MGRAVAQDRNSMALPPATGRLADANYRITADFVGRPNVFILYFTHALTVQSLRSDLPCSGLLYAPSEAAIFSPYFECLEKRVHA
jgi:hypothetical protein